MSFSSDNENQGLVLGVIFGVIALVVSLVIGLSMYTRNQETPPIVSAAASAESAAVPIDGARILVEKDVVKFYFAVGKAELATGASEALADVVKAVGAGKKVVIGGFHDASGDATLNEQLAKQRAVAVRDALTTLGVYATNIELKKPEAIPETGSAAEARRVELRLQ